MATHNALEIAAPPSAVWSVLIRATEWPRFYDNCANVKVVGGDELSAGCTFTWRTFGMPMRTLITEFEPERVLTWRGDTIFGRGGHTWELQPTQTGTRLVTEEVQRGFIPTLVGWWMTPQLLKWHQRWLEGIASQV